MTGGPILGAAFSRGCLGCGRNVPLDEWQSGPLGCAHCRRMMAQALTASPRPVRSPHRVFPGAGRG